MEEKNIDFDKLSIREIKISGDKVIINNSKTLNMTFRQLINVTKSDIRPNGGVDYYIQASDVHHP